MNQRLNWIALLGLLLGLSAGAAADIPFFWLDKPQGRSNPNDPNSPLFKRPTALPIAPVASNTATPTATPAASATATPTNSPAATPTSTATPVYDTWDPTDDSAGGATAVSVGGVTASHWIGSGADSYDYFSVALVAGHSYSIVASIGSGSGTIYLEDMGTSGASVLATYSGGSNATANPTAAGSGTYYYRVRSSAVLSYTFSVTDITGATPTFTPSSTPLPTATFTATPTPPATLTFTPSPSPTPGACAVACAGCIKYEDFELPLMGSYEYHDTGAAAVVTSTSTTEMHSCLASLAIGVNTGTGAYAAAGFGSNYYVSNVINASGSYYLNLWMKGPSAVNFKVSFSEYFGASDPQNEGWTSPNQSYTNAGNWQQFHIFLADFTENIYNSLCSPNCLSTGNNAIDLNVIGAMDISFQGSGINATYYVDDVSFDTTAPTATPTPAGTPVSFNNFEDGAACGSYTYNDGACTFAQAPAAGSAYNASAFGWQLTVNTDTPSFSWGAGGGTGAAGCAVIDATGRNNLVFWIRANKTSGAASSLGYAITLAETNVAVSWPATDPSNETWGAPAQSVTTFGTWQKVSIPLASFTEKMNNGACSPNCATQGNNTLDSNVMSGFDINITTAGFNGTVDIDDIQFE